MKYHIVKVSEAFYYCTTSDDNDDHATLRTLQAAEQRCAALNAATECARCDGSGFVPSAPSKDTDDICPVCFANGHDCPEPPPAWKGETP